MSYINAVILFIFILLLSFCVPVYPADVNKPVISIPFVINPDSRQDSRTIVPGDLELIINGEKRDILTVSRFERNLVKHTDLARDFVLSFSLSDPDEYMEKGLSYFLTEILAPSDSLSVVTPGKTFRIGVTSNKEGMHETIIKVLKKECDGYKKKKQAFSKNIRNELTKILNVLADKADSSAVFKVRRYKKIIGFLNSFPVEFNRFLQFSLALNEFKFDSAVSDIRFRSGEKWWFHFHRRESARLFSKIGKVIKEIEDYSSESGDLFSQDHAPLLKRLKILRYSTDFFPVGQIKEKMIRHGISFFSVIYTSSGDKSNSGSGSDKSVYDTIFDDIAEYTGGKSVYAVDPEDGVRRVSAESFTEYRVDFRYDGKIEKKKIVLRNKSSRSMKLYFPSGIPKDELKIMIEYLSSEKCSIRDLEFSKNKISFRIGGYKSLPEQNAGLLKVRFEIFSKTGELLHRKENILRSPVKDLPVQIPFPLKAAGEFLINVTVIDLVDNFKTEKKIQIRSG
ncbi:MAG: hypothetical protein ABFR36_06975 [Acidobacteriota bacterium]